MADILVTGGAGYIGSSLIPMLLNFGHKVTCFDSLLYRGDVLIPFFRRRGFEFIKGDVRDESAVEAAVQGKDIVIHLAAIVGLPACRENPSLAWAVNLEGTRNIVKALSPSQYLLFGSTGSNYGEVKGLSLVGLRRIKNRSGKSGESLWPVHSVPLCYCLWVVSEAPIGLVGKRFDFASHSLPICRGL